MNSFDNIMGQFLTTEVEQRERCEREMAAMTSAMQHRQPAPRNLVVMCHPETLHWFLAAVKPHIEVRSTGQWDLMPIKMPFDGLPVRTSAACPKFHRRWEFPKDWSSRFIGYETKDEVWAVPLGYGRWVETEERWLAVIEEKPMFDPSIFGIPESLLNAPESNYSFARQQMLMRLL